MVHALLGRAGRRCHIPLVGGAILVKGMKRILVSLLVLGLLSACAGVTAPGSAKADTPQQSLATTGKEMAKLASLRFDASATLTVPQALADQLRAKAGSQAQFLGTGNTIVLTATGTVARPDQLDATIKATIGSLTVNTELIAAGGNLYVKNPMTEKWETLSRHPGAAQDKTKAALSYQTVLDTAKSLSEINDQPSSLDGVSVDHYRIVPDLMKLYALATAGHTAQDSQMAAAIQDLLQNASVTADVWAGTSDHLIRRVSYDATVDLHALSALIGKAGSNGQGFTIPAGSVAHLTAVVNLHDFNAKVSIKAPTVTP